MTIQRRASSGSIWLPLLLGLSAPLLGCSAQPPTAGDASESYASSEQALNPDVPYRIQAENATAFLDSDQAHNGNCGSGALDAETTSDPNGGGCNVGWTAPGEWIEYYITTASARTVNLVARMASANAGKSLHFMLDGQNVGGSLTAPANGWQAFEDRTAENVSLTQGGHTLRVVFDTGDTNLNYIDITPPRAAVPARMEAENYQHAWETTPGTNSGGACDRGDGVDKESTSDNVGGCNIGWTAAGEWLDYDLSVAQAQRLDFTARVASGSTGKSLHLLLDGQAIGSALSAPSGGWQAFQDRTVSNISVGAGQHTLRVVFDTGDTNLNYLNITASPGQARLRKGLAVIADFQDRKLEDWTGAGFKSVADVTAQLSLMSQHWAWLSRSTEQFQWDTARITLPIAFSSTAYSSWGAYRDAVINQVKTQINPANYDLDQNGVMDTVWIIASAGSAQNVDYLIGGSALNAGAAAFVDSQSSGSVTSGLTGAFNHEVGHCALGLPDLYGTYGSLGVLSLMDTVWPLPGQDFSAYERTKAGWTVPQVISQSTNGIVLASTTSSFAAVKIPGALSNEYFLIEYRNRPSSGYGSGGNVAYNGLAVYHVLEGSDQGSNPPLLKLEAADHAMTANEPLTLTDFAYPGNPQQLNPLAFRSYLGGGEVFRIQNLAWQGSSLKFDVVVSTNSPTNLLSNASFEQGSGSPTSWSSSAWDPSASFAWSSSVAATGSHSVSITAATTPNDARWAQTLSGLTVGNRYYACGKLKGQNVATNANASVGATVFAGDGFTHTSSLSGTFDWTQSCMAFDADVSSLSVGCRLGYFGSTVTGSLWCDDLGLYQLIKPFQ